ncbi:MAG TPA: POTRA domain-containing protein [Vicinamibacterales bacterium]
MIRLSIGVCVGLVWLAGPLFAQAPAGEQPAGPVIQTIRIDGATIFTPEELANRYGLAEGTRLTRTTDEIARGIRDRYHEDGYTFATVEASLDLASGTLTISIDEGRFDLVSVAGVDEDTRKRILEELALAPGEVFNASQAERALNEALAFAQGAIARSEPTFTLLTDAGNRVLRVALRTRDYRGGVFLGTNGREDWYSPVDELNVGFGLHGTLFDKSEFNHTYWNAYVTRKTGPDRFGYSVGIERPFFRDALLQVGAAIHDLTATDDKWRLGDLEQSLAALMFRNTFRDYYRRKGYQLHAALRPFGAHEVLVAWRDDSHLALHNATDYGFFRDDHPFRGNGAAQPGDLRSLVVAYTFDSRGLDNRPSERYRRHLLDTLFADWAERETGMRFEWRSELAPAAFSHDFDFSRHVGTARAWWEATPRRTVSGRLMAGLSRGSLPGQRVFALGGIGTVRGYGFKEAAGDGMVLLNGELRQRFGRSPFAGLVFIDTGRVFEPRPGSSDNWMTGVGLGLEIGGGSRIEFGWRLADIPGSLQVLFRLRPTF